MNILSEADIEMVGGGETPVYTPDTFYLDQFLRYKNMQSSIFGDPNAPYATDENGHPIN